MRKLVVFLWHGLLLTATSVLLQTAGTAFNIFLSNRLGADGVGLFQLMLSVYGFAVTFASSGIHLAALRLVTEERARHSDDGISKSMRVCFLYSMLVGGFAAAALYLLSPMLSLHCLHDARCIPALRTMAVSIPFICASAALNGYFLAVRQVGKNAFSQCLETFFRILLSTAVLLFFLPGDLAYACFALALGGTVSEILSCICSYLLYRRGAKHHIAQSTSETAVLPRMLSITLPVSFSACVRSGLSTTEQLMIPFGLQKSGLSADTALSQYGVIHGMAMPLILFPSCLLYAFTGLLVPELTECLTNHQTVRIRHIAARTVELSFLFSIGVVGILFTYADYISDLFFRTGQVAYYLKLLAPLILLMYSDHAVDCMLKGLNEQLCSMRYNIIDSVLSVALVYTLLPRFGIHGYIAVLFASEMLNTVLSFHRLLYVTDCPFRPFAWLLKPICAMLLALFLANTFVTFFSLRGLPFLLVSVALSAIFYCAFLYVVRTPFASFRCPNRILHH